MQRTMTAEEALAEGLWVPSGASDSTIVVIGFREDGTQVWASIPPGDDVTD
jgi:hypothetical protein